MSTIKGQMLGRFGKKQYYVIQCVQENFWCAMPTLQHCHIYGRLNDQQSYHQLTCLALKHNHIRRCRGTTPG